MTDRVLDISERPGRLKVSLGRLVIEQADVDDITLPLSEIAVLIVSHKQVSYTQSVLSGLMEAGGVFVTCDEKHLPTGLMLPLAGHHKQAQRMERQASVSKPVCKRIWQQLVQAKIRGQGQVLHDITGDSLGIGKMADRVKSGDPDNIEAQAARKYWTALFRDPKFRRRQEAEDQNAQLNYGYGVMRAIVGRAVSGAGLHPSLGVHHRNQYNAYCLVDDLMEPYRPVVDYAVAHWVTVQGKAKRVDKEFKGFLFGAFRERYAMEGEKRSLFDCAHRTALSVVACIEGESKEVAAPEL